MQIIRKGIPESRSRLQSARGLYDPLVSLNAVFTDSEKAQATTIFGTKTTTSDLSLSVDQYLFTGGRLGLNLSGRKTDTNSIFTTLNPSYFSDFSVTLSQSLLKNIWGRQDEEAVYLAQNGVRIADFKVYEEMADFILNFNRLYWNLVHADKTLKIIEDSLSRVRKLLNHNIKRYKRGLVEETDIVQLKAIVALREVDALKAYDERIDAEDILKDAIYKEGINNKNVIVPAESLNVPDDDFSIHSLTHIRQQAVDKRWDINQARLDVDNKKYSFSARANELLPSLDLTGGLSYTGVGDSVNAAYDSTKSGNHPVWFGSVLFQIPLGNNTLKGLYQSALYEYEIAQLKLKDIEKNILVETARVYRRVRTSVKSVQASQKAEQLQEKKLALEEEKFKQGRSSVKIIIDFQDDLQQSQLTALQSLINHTLALVRLDYTQGLLIEKIGIQP